MSHLYCKVNFSVFVVYMLQWVKSCQKTFRLLPMSLH